jgi:hypothetical protein
MFRIPAGLALGAIVASAVVLGVDAAGHTVYPYPPNLDFDDMDAVRHFVAGQSFGAQAFVLASFFAGGFAGNLAAGWVIGPGKRFWTMLPSLLVAGGVLAMNNMIPHASWFVATGVVGTLVLGWAGAGLGERLRQPFLPKHPGWKGGTR